jgi:hypothetical protein
MGEGSGRGRRRPGGWVVVAAFVAVGIACAPVHASAGASTPAACVAAVRNVPVPSFRLVVQPASDLVYTRTDVRPPQIVVGERAFERWGCHAVIHELGHALDMTMMTPATRRRFATEFLHDPRPWSVPAQNSPVERFAEIYHLCALGLPVARAASSAQLELTRRELAGACAYIEGLGAKPAPRA